MKIRNGAILLTALLAIFLLSGCSVRSAYRTLDAIEDAVAHRLDAAEDAVEDAVHPTPVLENKRPAESVTQLTPEAAQTIALNHAGFITDQVSRLHIEFEIDNRIPHYDVAFHQGQWEYEYEIHGETGNILSYEKDK